MKANISCPVCSTNESAQIAHHVFLSEGKNERTNLLNKLYRDHFSPEGEVAVKECDNCGFIWTDPRLSQEDLKLKYRLIAEFDLNSRSGQPPHLPERRKRTVTLSQQLLTNKTNARILDYGGAEGYLLSPLIDRGHNGYVIDYIDYPKEDDRITYLGNDLQAVPVLEESFDLIFALHTLEHVSDPVHVLKELATLLRPDGKLYVEVPLGAWLEWAFLREPLTHINFFSEQSFAAVAEEAGLHVHQIDSAWQYVTHSRKTACINMVVGKTPPATSTSPRTTQQQKQALSQGLIPLMVHSRFYLKNMVKYTASGAV